MLFEFSITTPANTPESNKQKTILKLLKGKITNIVVWIPPGPSGLLHLQIFRSKRQIYPINDGSSIAGDNLKLNISDEIALFAEPYQLEAYTWNDDDTFEHTVDIYISLSRSGVFIE